MKKCLKMNLAVFTSNHLRHKYIATEIAKVLPLELIICEEKSAVIQDTSNYNNADTLLLKNHFKNREISENLFFEECYNFPCDSSLVNIKFGEINSKNILKLLSDYKIDFILLFGSSIIKSMILEKYGDKIINLHLGLSPYYKGSGTNFFPIVNNEFECLGATIHLANHKVDAGCILHQLRPDVISLNDDIYTLGNKIIKKAGIVFPQIVKKYLLGQIKPQVQRKLINSKEYRLKDFTPENLRIASTIIKNGGISEYLKNKIERLNSKPIINNYNE